MSTLVDTAGLIHDLWQDAETAPSERFITRLREEGKIPYVKLGHLIYFDPEAVRKVIMESFKGQPKRSK
ncbi:MAG TPA: hypothetical protein P5205_07560 [Candidatus Paceibacterota bacterium]|nr:hypothetical protein [Verrucomicrobiota bacterium]HSA10214.1 hypothetical protein [Candidatus Paceibacterota bacterium]